MTSITAAPTPTATPNLKLYLSVREMAAAFTGPIGIDISHPGIAPIRKATITNRKLNMYSLFDLPKRSLELCRMGAVMVFHRCEDGHRIHIAILRMGSHEPPVARFHGTDEFLGLRTSGAKVGNTGLIVFLIVAAFGRYCVGVHLLKMTHRSIDEPADTCLPQTLDIEHVIDNLGRTERGKGRLFADALARVSVCRLQKDLKTFI